LGYDELPLQGVNQRAELKTDAGKFQFSDPRMGKPNGENPGLKAQIIITQCKT
jgi:hypothetical protein